jgi:hypothetical protein
MIGGLSGIVMAYISSEYDAGKRYKTANNSVNCADIRGAKCDYANVCPFQRVPFVPCSCSIKRIRRNDSSKAIVSEHHAGGRQIELGPSSLPNGSFRYCNRHCPRGWNNHRFEILLQLKYHDTGSLSLPHSQIL